MASTTELAQFAALLANATAAPEYCFLWIQWWPFCMDKPAWAAWAQAILSALAILAAVQLAQRQHVRETQKARTEQIQSEIRRYKALFQLMARAQDVALRFLNLLEKEMNEGGSFSWQRVVQIVDASRSEMESCSDAFNRIDPLLFDRVEVTEAVLVCSGMTRIYVEFFSRENRVGGGSEGDMEDWKANAAGLRTQFNARLKTVRAAVDELELALHEE